MPSYRHVISGTFLKRPNRFIAHVKLTESPNFLANVPRGTFTNLPLKTSNFCAENVVIAHVKNTGRCREILTPQTRVWLSVAPENTTRKTQYDLIAVEKQITPYKLPRIINIDSQIPNDVAEAWLRSPKCTLFSPRASIRREVTHGASRFDFYIEDIGINGTIRRAFLEVKGVTLESNNIAKFPDAPTKRGTKHLRELSACIFEGFEAYVLFVIQMKGIQQFQPNDQTDPDFGHALRKAKKSGVNILAMDCDVSPDQIELNQQIPIIL